jgi:2-haloacid dehalogenase
VAFDVVETMFSLEVVGRTLADEGAGPRALDVFFGRLLRDGFALAASGTYAPFGQVAHAALTATALTLTSAGGAGCSMRSRRLSPTQTSVPRSSGWLRSPSRW